ncbi:MAG: DUF5689 domain-containing protein [Bacteroidota bacterium]
MKNKSFRLFALLAAGIIVVSGCVKKEYDEPPAVTIPTGKVITIADLHQMYQDSIVGVSGVTTYKFTEDYSIYAVVTMDDKLGNIYKSAYLESGGYAINLHLLSSGGLYVGDSVRVYLKGLVLGDYSGQLQLDSVNVDKHIFKQATGKDHNPMKVTIADIIANSTNPMYKGRLIQIDSIEFVDANTTWADAEGLNTVNNYIVDKDGNQMIVRTSGYASFAGDSLPKGNGSIIGVYSPYGSDLQLYVRDPKECSMNGTRNLYLSKNFDDSNVFSGGWTEQKVIGNIGWTIYASSNPAAQITNYSGGNTACETWLISPALDLSQSTAPGLSFRNASGYNGPELEVWVSTNYSGSGLPNASATWTQKQFTLCPQSPNWSWTDSGVIDLTNHKGTAVYFAFKYTGSNSDGRTWEVDDILVSEQ